VGREICPLFERDMTFTPPRSAISNISMSNPAIVTTSSAHGLTTGQIVRINVPNNFGMVQLNQKLLSVTVLDETNFSLQYTQVPPAVNVDSTDFTQFVIPSNPKFTAESLAVGSGPTPFTLPYFSSLGICVSNVDDATINNSTVSIPI